MLRASFGNAVCASTAIQNFQVVPRWWNELPSTTRAGASLSTFKKLLNTQLFREHLPSYMALRLVLNLHLQQLHSCTLFLFPISFFYFLCKVVFIVTLGLYCSYLDCSIPCTSLWTKVSAK